MQISHCCVLVQAAGGKHAVKDTCGLETLAAKPSIQTLAFHGCFYSTGGRGSKVTPGRMPLNATRRNAAPSFKRCLPPSATDASLRQSDSLRSPRFRAAICFPAHRLQRLLLPLCLRLSTQICCVCTSDISKVSDFILKEKNMPTKWNLAVLPCGEKH